MTVDVDEWGRGRIDVFTIYTCATLDAVIHYLKDSAVLAVFRGGLLLYDDFYDFGSSDAARVFGRLEGLLARSGGASVAWMAVSLQVALAPPARYPK